MKRSTLFAASLAGMFLMCGGCASHQTDSRVSMISARDTVSLTTLEPSATSSNATANAKAFRLGAGDALGEAIYDNYAVIARANAGWQYASGSTTE